MQGLATTENRGERLNRNADDIVFRLLSGERRTGGLRVEAKHQRARILCAEAFHHNARPEAAGGAVLGDFLEKVVVGVEKERKLRSEFVDAKPGVKRGLDVSDAISEGEGDFLDSGRASFADVIAGDGNRVPLGEMVAAPGENVGDDAHRGADGIDVRATGDVLL